MNSPQSQKLAVGSKVSKYVAVAITNATQPKITLRDLNRFIESFIEKFFSFLLNI
jgi:methionine aminopeptidase